MCYEWLGEVGLERKKGHLHCFKLIAKLHLHILLHLCKAKSWEFHKYVEAGKICWDNLKFSHCNCNLPFPSCRCTPLASFHCSLQPYTWGQTHLKSSEIKSCQLLEQGVWRIIYFLVLPCLHSLLRCLASSGPMGVCLLSMFDPSMPWALHFQSLKTQPFNLKPFKQASLGFVGNIVQNKINIWCSIAGQLRCRCNRFVTSAVPFCKTCAPFPTSPDLDLF